MGCDIHVWVEVKALIEGEMKWVGLKHNSDRCDDRNYQRFAALAGVRGDGPEPLGFPEDASDSARLDYEGWGGDAHSASFLPLAAATMIYQGTEYEHELRPDATEEDRRQRSHAETMRKQHPEYHYFGIDMEYQNSRTNGAGEYRIVFWFDN